MDDLTMINQGTFALQNAQTQSIMNTNDKLNGQSDFAKMLPLDPSHDASYMKAMQRKKIKETAQEFEAQFLSQMLQPMFEGIQAEQPFGGGHAEKMWQSMLVQEYGKSLAKNGGIGLAENIERELIRAQEGKDQ